MGQLLPNPSNVPVSVSGDWEPLVNVNAAGNVGFNALSLTNWDAGTLAPAIAAGSLIEIDGSIAYFQTDEVIAGAADGLNYLQFVVSGTTVTPSWTLTPPTWSFQHGAWMIGGNRASGHSMVRKAGLFINKTCKLQTFENGADVQLAYKYFTGQKTVQTLNIPHGLDWTRIVGVMSARMRATALTTWYYPAFKDPSNSTGRDWLTATFNETNITIQTDTQSTNEGIWFDCYYRIVVAYLR